MFSPLFLIADHLFSIAGCLFDVGPLRACTFDGRGLQGRSIHHQQGFWAGTGQCEPQIVGVSVGGERGGVAPHQSLVNGVRVVNLALPMLSDVYLVNLPVDNTLAHSFNVVFVGLSGVRDDVPVRLR